MATIIDSSAAEAAAREAALRALQEARRRAEEARRKADQARAEAKKRAEADKGQAENKRNHSNFQPGQGDRQGVPVAIEQGKDAMPVAIARDAALEALRSSTSPEMLQSSLNQWMPPSSNGYAMGGGDPSTASNAAGAEDAAPSDDKASSGKEAAPGGESASALDVAGDTTGKASAASGAEAVAEVDAFPEIEAGVPEEDLKPADEDGPASEGPEVVKYQKLLVESGYLEPSQVTGRFDEDTRAATETVQLEMVEAGLMDPAGLATGPGYAGPRTRANFYTALGQNFPPDEAQRLADFSIGGALHVPGGATGSADASAYASDDVGSTGSTGQATSVQPYSVSPSEVEAARASGVSSAGLSPSAAYVVELANGHGLHLISGVSDHNIYHMDGYSIDVSDPAENKVGEETPQMRAYADDMVARGRSGELGPDGMPLVTHVVYAGKYANASTGWEWVTVSDPDSLVDGHWNHVHVQVRSIG